MLFDVLIIAIEIILIAMPIISIVGTGVLYYLWIKSGGNKWLTRGGNRWIRVNMITSLMVTVGGLWWAFVALRRIALGPEGPALGEWALVFYALSLFLILLTPAIKAIGVIMISSMRISKEELDKLDALIYSVRAETQNQREDRHFGDARRALEDRHNLDNTE